MANKLLSASMTTLKAYTWQMNTRENILRYGDIDNNTERNIFELDTMDKFIENMYVDDQAEYRESFNTFLHGDSGNISIIYRIDLDVKGKYEWWESRMVIETVHDKHGEYKQIFGIDLNINAQKLNEIRLQNSKQRLALLNRQNKLILNNISSALLYIDTNYEVQWSNVEHVFGAINGNSYRRGDKCYYGFGRTEPCVNCPAKVAIGRHEVSRQEFNYLPDGVFDSIAAPVEGVNGLEGVVVRLDNVTERIKLIDDLKYAKERAEQSDHLKMAFLANMSHEIRTPLNAIVGFSELIPYCENSEERDEYIRIINSNNELLLHLVEDILDLSKIESGMIEIKKSRFDIVDEFHEVITAFKARHTKKEIQLIANNPYEHLMVNLDRNRIRQVMGNFLSNAFKYTEQGTITATLHIENNGVKISVKDTGIGIDDEKQKLVFGRFEKLDSFAQGTGLGLAISKAITDTIGGKIGFESKKNVGSTFWAWFPLES